MTSVVENVVIGVRFPVTKFGKVVTPLLDARIPPTQPWNARLTALSRTRPMSIRMGFMVR
jgi:hypothetical protein